MHWRSGNRISRSTRGTLMCFIWGPIHRRAGFGWQLSNRRNPPSIRFSTIAVLQHEGSLIHLSGHRIGRLLSRRRLSVLTVETAYSPLALTPATRVVLHNQSEPSFSASLSLRPQFLAAHTSSTRHSLLSPLTICFYALAHAAKTACSRRVDTSSRPAMMPTMTTNTNPKSTAPTTDVDAFDPAEVSRVVSLIRHELSVLAQDAKRKRPLYSKSTDEAVARRNASFKSLTEFASHLDAMKRN